MESAKAHHFGFLPDPIQASQDNGPRVLAHQRVLVRRSRRVAKELAEQRLDGVRQCGCALFDAVRVCRHLSPPSLWSADFESHAGRDRSMIRFCCAMRAARSRIAFACARIARALSRMTRARAKGFRGSSSGPGHEFPILVIREVSAAMPLGLSQAVAPDVEPEGGAPLILRLKLDLRTQDRLITPRARPAASLARPPPGGPIEGQRAAIDL